MMFVLPAGGGYSTEAVEFVLGLHRTGLVAPGRWACAPVPPRPAASPLTNSSLSNRRGAHKTCIHTLFPAIYPSFMVSHGQHGQQHSSPPTTTQHAHTCVCLPNGPLLYHAYRLWLSQHGDLESPDVLLGMDATTQRELLGMLKLGYGQFYADSREAIIVCHSVPGACEVPIG